MQGYHLFYIYSYSRLEKSKSLITPGSQQLEALAVVGRNIIIIQGYHLFYIYSYSRLKKSESSITQGSQQGGWRWGGRGGGSGGTLISASTVPKGGMVMKQRAAEGRALGHRVSG